MRINNVSSLISTGKYDSVKNLKAKVSNPVYTIENRTKLPSDNISFAGRFEVEQQKRFKNSTNYFTQSAYNTWNNTTYLAKKYGQREIGYNHLYASVLHDLIKYIDNLDSGTERYGSGANLLSPFSFEEIVGIPSLFNSPQSRKKCKAILLRHLKQTLRELKNEPGGKGNFGRLSVNNQLLLSINASCDTVQKITDSDNFTDNVFLIALANSPASKFSKKFYNLIFDLQKALMVDDISLKEKNHLQFYDNIADKLWKNLDLGNNMFVTYDGDNSDSQNYLISSFVNLIRKPNQKYNKLNKENTNIITFNSNVNFELLAKFMSEAKDNPEKTYIFIIDFSKILQNNTYTPDGENGMLSPAKFSLIKKSVLPNVRIIFSSSKNVYYSMGSSKTGFEQMLDNYGMIPIPMINADGAKDILAKESGQKYIYNKIGKRFSPEAISLSVDLTSESNGYYPEKAIAYMGKVAAYYVDKKDINADDVKSYENEISEIMQKSSENTQNEFKIVFDTGKTLDDIIGSDMTKAEAKSIVNQIRSVKKGYVRGITTFLDNGTSYGGGRKHTAECIAGEAGIPMITINARDFALKDIDALSANSNLSELKIKSLISTARAQAQANKNNTAMIYIENFDNFGSNPLAGISSIYEQKAFSQLLEEMDNLRKKNDVNVIIIGSTNYPNVLDENIMKPYKFLNKIIIYSPQEDKDREDILRYYIEKNNIKVGATQQDKENIIKNAAETTMGFSVVDIIYLLEKAEQISKERNKDVIDKSDMTEAFLQTTTGRVSSGVHREFQNEMTAKHECGHALTLQIMYDIAKKQNQPWHLPNKVNFITLDPRGNFGGAMYPKMSENTEYSFEKVFSQIVCDFGGYSTENSFYNMNGSYGITQDLSNATTMANFAVQKMGMGPSTGRISIDSDEEISENLRSRIDDDVEVILKNAEYISNKIVLAYSDFISQFAEKYKDKVGTGDCLVMSDEFQAQLANWRNSQNPDKIKELQKLEDEILQIIQKTKQGKLVK